MKKRSRWMAGAVAATALISTGSMLAAGRAGQMPGGSVTGVWYGTTYLGDPNDPTTPKLQFAMTLHTDRTVVVTASDHTGEHPILIGETTPGQGIWEHSQGKIAVKFFEFAEGPNPPATFSLLRVSGLCSFNDEGKLVGTGGFDYVTCPNGPVGCLSPNSSPFPTPDQFPFEMERLQ